MPSTVMRCLGSTVKMRRRRSFASSVICMGMAKEALAMFLMRERVSAWSPAGGGGGGRPVGERGREAAGGQAAEPVKA